MRKTAWVLIRPVLFLALILPAGIVPARAQGEVEARVVPYQLNVRATPGPGAPVLGQFMGGTVVRVTGREDDPHDTGVWVFAASPDGALSGWVLSDYLRFPAGFDVLSLPVIEAAGAAGAGESAPAPAEPAEPTAPGGVTATTASVINVRAGPGTGFEAIRQLPAGTAVGLTGRSADGSWVQAEIDGQPGWLYTPLLRIAGDVYALPVVNPPAADSAPPPEPAALPPGVPAGVVPTIGPRAREIFLAGQARGNRANVFSKVGDSITDSPLFLKQIGWGQAQLGDYGALAAVIDHFSAAVARDGSSFENTSLAARGMWTSFDPLDPASVFTPGLCRRGESPLACEYRVVRPAAALILIGTNDIYFGLDSASYRANLESIVQTSIDMGVIPVLSTLPDNLHGPDQGARVLEFNDIVRGVAAAYGVPLWDYWRALQDLPNRGISFDGLHPSYDLAPGTAAIFTPDYLQYGCNMRNLTALLVLDAVWRGALY